MRLKKQLSIQHIILYQYKFCQFASCQRFEKLLKGILIEWGARWHSELQTGRSRVRFPMVSLEFFIDIIPPVAPWPWGRLSLQHKWVPGVFLGVKGGRCVRLTTLPPSCAVFMRSGKHNFLERSGPLQACNGTDVPFILVEYAV